MRQAAMGGGVAVGRWCGGIWIQPAGDGPEHALAAERVYLDSDDLVRLLVFQMGEDGAVEVLHDEAVEWAAAWLRRQPNGEPFDGGYPQESKRDRIFHYWDRQP